MIGMTFTVDGTTGTVDATAVQADGLALARINDRWFDVSALVARKNGG